MYRPYDRPYGAPWPGVDEADHQEALRASLALVGFLGGRALGAWVVEQGPSVGLWPRTVTAALAPEWGVLLVCRRVAVHRWGGGHVCGPGFPDRALGAGHGGVKRRLAPTRGFGDCDHVYHGDRDDARGMAHAMARWGRRHHFQATAGGHDRLRSPPTGAACGGTAGGRVGDVPWRGDGGGCLCAPRPGVGRALPSRAHADRQGHRGGSLAAVTGAFSSRVHPLSHPTSPERGVFLALASSPSHNDETQDIDHSPPRQPAPRR
jgi:hypothetical protein